MKLFDEKFVHVLWNDDLAGSQGFVANNIQELIEKVEEKRPDKQFEIRKSENQNAPFFMSGIGCSYPFAYIDPYYEIKVAYLEGKTIEWYNTFKDCWCPIDNDTNFILAINEQNKLRIAKNDTKYWVIATYSQFVDIENYKIFGPCYHVEEQQNDYSRSNPPLAKDFESYEAAQEWLKKYLQDRKIYKHVANLIKTFIGQLEIFRSHIENNEQIPRDEFEACFESFSLSLNGDVNNQLIFKDKENEEE
ncbi:MAG: hypothetical protein IKK93_12025 [Campylobacter sp.]|nr:hypothetical protein [Campylobacter sp.]